MKKDRNCGAVPYPIYPSYQGMGMVPQGMMPSMMPSMMQPTQNMAMASTNFQNYQTTSSGTIEQQLTNLNNQVASLEKRISSLESLVGNKYNSSNFQVM